MTTKFRYTARDRAGLLREGTVEAADRASALAQLQQGGSVVSRLEEAGGTFGLNTELHFGARRRVNSTDLALFCDQFSCLLGAGVPILQSLQVLEVQFKAKRLGSIVSAVGQSIRGGSGLSQALREHQEYLPATLLYITAVSEVSGRLDEAFELLARQYEREAQLAQKVRTAMTYPIAVMVIALIVVVFMLTFVLPTYGTMFQQMGATLPAPTRILMAIGAGFQRYYYLLPVVPLLLWFSFQRLLRLQAVRGAWGRLELKLPVWGALRYKRELARLSRTLATMLNSGVPLMAALGILQEVLDFAPMKQALSAIAEDLAGGDTFGDALRRQTVFDRISVEMTALGEQAGALDTMLFRVANTADKDVAVLLDRLVALMEPALTVVLGGVVVGILVPIILPMFDILGQVR